MAILDLSVLGDVSELSAEDLFARISETDFEDVVAKSQYDAEINKYAKLKKSFDKTASELTAFKKKANQLESGESEEIKALKARLETVEKDKMTADFTAQYLGMGFEEEDASAMASAQVAGDNETFFTKQKEAQAKLLESMKQKHMEKTPKPNGALGATGGITKEQFIKMSYSERTELRKTNPDEYTRLQGEIQNG